MKAVIYKEYGDINVLKYTEIEKPIPNNNNILVKVVATSVTPMDWKFRSGKVFLARLMSGVQRPKNQILGVEISGTIEAIGTNVTSFKVGDRVFGVLQNGGYAEYVCLSENQLLLAPESMTLEEAATIPFGATTAYHFLVDLGSIQKGERILINGASGGVGIFAIQIAKYYGAHVTGVCSSNNKQLVKSLGADKVIDYKKDDFTQMNQRYDIIFDVVGNSSFSKCKCLLNDGGRFYTTILTFGIVGQMFLTAMQKNYTAKFSLPPFPPINELNSVSDIINKGRLKTVIGARYNLKDIAQAHHYAQKGHAIAKTLINVSIKQHT